MVTPVEMIQPITPLHDDFTECVAFVAGLSKRAPFHSEVAQSSSAFLATHVMLFQSLIVSLEGCAHDTIRLRLRLGQLEAPTGIERSDLNESDYDRLMSLSWQATRAHATRTSKTLRDMQRALSDAMSRCEESLRKEAGDRDYYALNKARLSTTQVVADTVATAAGVLVFFSGSKQTATLKNAARAFCWFTLSNIAFNLVNNAFALRESNASKAAVDFGLLLGNYQRLDRIVAEHARWWDAMSMLSTDALLSAPTESKQSPWDLIVQQYQTYHGEVEEIIRSFEAHGLKKRRSGLDSTASTMSTRSLRLDRSMSSSFSSFADMDELSDTVSIF